MAKTHGTVLKALKAAATASTEKRTPGVGRVLIAGEWIDVAVEGETVAALRVTVAMPPRYAAARANATHWVEVRRAGEATAATYTRGELANAARWLLGASNV